MWRCAKNSAGTMSSRSLTSSPMRTIGRPQPGAGQWVSSGSWWCSTRRRCSGIGSRRGWRLVRPSAAGRCRRLGAAKRIDAGLQVGLVLGQRLLEQAALVSGHRLGRAPNFKRFSRASSKVSF